MSIVHLSEQADKCLKIKPGRLTGFDISFNDISGEFAKLFSDFRNLNCEIEAVILIPCRRIVWQFHEDVYLCTSRILFCNTATVISIDNESEEF